MLVKSPYYEQPAYWRAPRAVVEKFNLYIEGDRDNWRVARVPMYAPPVPFPRVKATPPKYCESYLPSPLIESSNDNTNNFGALYAIRKQFGRFEGHAAVDFGYYQQKQFTQQ